MKTPPNDLPAVLAVEDDPDTQDMLRLLLRRHCDLECAASAAAARAAIESRGSEWVAVLLDVRLEGEETGLDFVHWLRQQSQWAAIPVVATTAFALIDDERSALEAGCDHFLPKPISPEKLKDLINAFASSHRRRTPGSHKNDQRAESDAPK